MIHIWNHSYGRQEQQDLVVCRPYAIPESYEEAEMIDNGWLALDTPIHHEGRLQECFYQSRSTRIALRKYRAPKSRAQWQGQTIHMMEIRPEQHNIEMTGLRSVYQKYLKRTKFRDLYDPFAHVQDRDAFLIYYLGDVTNIIGFSKIKRYWFQEELLNFNSRRDLARVHPDQCYAVESVLHANTVPISKVTIDMEATWAKKRNVSEFYLGSGYETSSIYKSQFKGFEWWTGTEWSTDKKRYVQLCERDSRLKKISDLANLPHL